MSDSTSLIQLEIRLIDAGRPEEAAQLEVTIGGTKRLEFAVRQADIPALFEPNDTLAKVLLGNLVDLLAHKDLPQAAPLWLSFVSPAGRLPGYAWETAIQPAIGRPVLRKSYLTSQSIPRVEALTVVVCASAPISKADFDVPEAILALMQQMVAVPQTPVNVHVFADAEVYPNLVARMPTNTPGRTIAIYNPAEVDFEVPGRTRNVVDGPTVKNPWLRWICDRLPPHEAVSVVHFAAHGFQSLDFGALAFAESPNRNEDRSYARFVGAEQIAAFAMRLGAWAIGFGSPPRNHSPMGLNLLADGLARGYAGPIFVHDLGVADARTAAAMYRFLCEPTELPNAVLSAYLSPEGLRAFATQRESTRKAPPQRWKAATERFLEQQRAQAIATNTGHDRGREIALQYIEELLSSEQPEDPQSGVGNAVREYADALDAALSKWGPELQGQLTLDDIPKLANVSAAISHIQSEVGNTERLLTNLAQQPGTKTIVAAADPSKWFDVVRNAQEKLDQSREVLGWAIRASTGTQGSPIRRQHDADVVSPPGDGLRDLEQTEDVAPDESEANAKLSQAWDGILDFVKDAPELTRHVREIADQFPDIGGFSAAKKPSILDSLGLFPTNPAGE